MQPRNGAQEVRPSVEASILPEPAPASRLLDTEYPEIDMAIDPYWPRGELVELNGAHGIFKSTIALGACLSVATGRTWGGARVKQGRAVFATMEDAERTLARRVRAWLDGVPAGQERGDAEADIRRNFAFIAREEARTLALTETEGVHTGLRVHVVEHLARVLDGSHLAVLETTARLHDGPELNEALSVFAQGVEEIAIKSGASTGVVRHQGKMAAREGMTDSYAGRGGGALAYAARSVMVVVRAKPEEVTEEEDDRLAPVRLVHAKATHTATGPTIVWRPVVCEHGVYLYALSDRERERAECQRLVAYLRGHGEAGLTRSSLHKRQPAGLSRDAALRALDVLVADGRVVSTEERRGTTKQLATVFRLREGGER
jgi:hypothetical protein